MNGTRHSGFSLVEMIMVIVIAAIVFPTLILPFIDGSRKIEVPLTRGILALLAQEEMEKNIIPLNDYEDVVAAAWAERAIDGFPEYLSTCVIYPVSDHLFNTESDVETGYSRIEVTVSKGGESTSLVVVKTNWTEATSSFSEPTS